MSIYISKNFLPKRYFVTSGKGEDPVSTLNAFDLALRDAGIEHLNIVPVSSILPEGSEEVEYTRIAPGSVVFVVMARQDGYGDEEITAGLAWGFAEGTNERYGFVVEDHGYKSAEDCKEMLKRKIERMAEIRNMKLLWVKYKIESLKISRNMFGSVVSVLVFLPP
ncbi:MAG: pyruvoyl-dependent arginine decarboxylase [Euryarchaeota archaeon]|nr:pyruvoyl-dependent arginine decarboxylase [Euryarchaeota archaeon]